MEVLSVIEVLFSDPAYDLNRKNLWVSHSGPDIMITGPASSSYNNCSIILP